jgi:hypothetical protein
LAASLPVLVVANHVKGIARFVAEIRGKIDWHVRVLRSLFCILAWNFGKIKLYFRPALGACGGSFSGRSIVLQGFRPALEKRKAVLAAAENAGQEVFAITSGVPKPLRRIVLERDSYTCMRHSAKTPRPTFITSSRAPVAARITGGTSLRCADTIRGASSRSVHAAE